MLSVEGADISELQAGKGRWNDNHGKGFFNSIGRITQAKKIFKEEDCDDDRQRYYWNKVKAPYVYVKGYLYDDEDHPNAKAAAAILRNVHKVDCPLKLKASVEGGVISRGISDPSLLARTKIHSVALTFTPANNATLVEPLSLDKSQYDEAADMVLIRSVMHLAETNVPSFRHMARDASASKVRSNIEKIVSLMKGDETIDIPTKQEILQYALEAKIQNNVSMIHEMIEEELDKGLKDAIMGAAMSGAAALNPSPSPSTVPPTPQVQQASQAQPAQPKVTHASIYSDISKKYPVLGAIGRIESNGGENLKHPVIDKKVLKNFYGIEHGKSMNEGMSAGGAYGIMPLSAAFIINKDPELAKKYPKLAEAAKDVHKNHKLFTEALNNDPNIDADFAVSLYNRNKGKTRSDKQLIYSWLHGLKGSWERLKNQGSKSFDSNPYVQKVMQEYVKMHPPKAAHKSKKPKLNKALSAGYGGSGAPTANTGGGVLQGEALDDGRGSKDKSFKYVVCNDCGKEQIYSKYQVKCRECGKSFPMEKLHKLFLGAIAT